MTAVANLRGSNYYIQSHDRFATKGIAGKIIPALATTTSIVSGLVSLEFYKISHGLIDKSYNNLEKYRYGTFNLADQTFCFSAPNPPAITIVGETSFSSWTKISIQSTEKLKDLVSKWSDLSIIRKINGKKTETWNNYAFMSDNNKMMKMRIICSK
jgi:ubiquitin-activating enzyme E1